ncbi:MAG TPA: hypothetical protein VK483_10345 [Chitinophagaceae bacterium]|nr:hypothetical protein [Chitinophagaceae bacterium]
MKRGFVKQVASFFALFCIVFVPFPFNLTGVQFSVTESIFGDLIGFVSSTMFGQTLTDTEVHSDTIAMYVLVLILFILSVLAAMILSKLKSWARYKDKVLKFIYLLACYYLALQLLKYGLDKVFKNQFYLPEPNTLYTPVGRIPKDLLYWSSMGTSRFYNVFLGSLETLAALFLLIKRTRLVGLLLSFFIMINIVAVNFGFDISVKLFSLLLLFLTLYLLAPYIKSLYQYFFTERTVERKPNPAETVLIQNRFLSACLKCFAAGIIFLEALYPFIKTGNFNGDKAARPNMHGAYEVIRYIAGSDTLPPASFPVKRFFIHKDSYMIFQNSEDEMTDYKLGYNIGKYEYVLIDYQLHKIPIRFNYNKADSVLTLQYSSGGKAFQLTGKALDWRKLPALRNGFHWTVD